MQPLVSSLACSAFLALVACGPAQDLGPAVTCTDVSVEDVANECDIIASQECSDHNFDEIDCGDDATCTCVQNGMQTTSFLASDQTSGFCATLTVSMFHDLATNCVSSDNTHWNVNP